MRSASLSIIMLVGLLSPAFAQDNRRPIRDLLPVNGDTVIALNQGTGGIISFNAGKTWEPIIPGKYFKKMTVDNRGVIWAIDSWVGIHESDHSRLYKSTDGGKTWQETIFDTNNFFPLEFVSKDREPLRIRTYEQKEYTLTGKNTLTDWKHVARQKQTDSTTVDAIVKGKYKLLKGKHFGKLLRKSSRWDTIYHFKYLNAYDMHVRNNEVYVGGFTSGIEGKGYFASYINNKVRVYPVGPHHVYAIREDSKGRLWVCTADGIYLLRAANTIAKVY